MLQKREQAPNCGSNEEEKNIVSVQNRYYATTGR
jgi:hypothetical protein